MVKVEAVVIRERVETVMDAVTEQTGHVGVTVIEAVGHGRQPGITHEYRGRVFESRFLPKAHSGCSSSRTSSADDVVAAVADAARSGHESGDGICWTTPTSASPTTEPASGSRRSMLHDDQGARHCDEHDLGRGSPPSW